MKFDWDPAKNRQNLLFHGIGFADAATVFDGPTFEWLDDRVDYGEERWMAVGLWKGIGLHDMSAKRSTVRSAGKQRAPRKARASRTDWERLRRMTDEEAHANALRDPDAPPATAEWLAAGRLVEPQRKQAISIRIDPDVIEWFRSTGPRYQSRMNAVLRAFVEHNRRKGDL